MKLRFITLITLSVFAVTFPREAKCQVPDSICAKIEYTFDDLNGEKRYQSPDIVKRKGGGIEQAKVVFVKTIKRLFPPEYFVSLYTTVPTPMLVQQGVVLTLANGQKITKPRVAVTTDEDYTGKFSRRSYVPLNDADLALLRRSAIKKYQLFNDVDSLADAEDYRAMLNCLTNRK